MQSCGLSVYETPKATRKVGREPRPCCNPAKLKVEEEILVAADIIRTVVLEPTLANVLVLGLLVVIRTFLSWSLVLEIEERWPWQARSTTEGTPAHKL